MYDQQSPRSAWAYAQSDQSLCWTLEYSMRVKLLNKHHLEFLSLKGGCTCQNTILLEITCHGSDIKALFFIKSQKKLIASKILLIILKILSIYPDIEQKVPVAQVQMVSTWRNQLNSVSNKLLKKK